MNEELKKEAEALIEKYLKVDFGCIDEYIPVPTQLCEALAILECQSIIDELELMKHECYVYNNELYKSRITHYQELIKQIESI